MNYTLKQIDELEAGTRDMKKEGIWVSLAEIDNLEDHILRLIEDWRALRLRRWHYDRAWRL